MPASKKVPEPWDSFLRELDEKAAEETRLDCMGGFVVTQLYGFSRETSDLDVLVIAPKSSSSLCSHAKAESFTKSIGFIWTTWASQKCRRTMKAVLRKCFLRRTSVCACVPSILTIWHYPSWSGTSKRDRDDVKHLARSVPLDLNVLKVRYEKELRWQLGNPEREDLTLKLWIEMIEEDRRESAARS